MGIEQNSNHQAVWQCGTIGLELIEGDPTTVSCVHCAKTLK